VLFNLTTASVILFVSIAISNTAVAGLVGTLIMLYKYAFFLPFESHTNQIFSLLFAGLLINRDTVSPYVDWLHTFSFYHAAFEGMAVNELRYLSLKEIKVGATSLVCIELVIDNFFQFGVELDVPAATILSLFGFRAQAYWFPDMLVLGAMLTGFMVLSFLWLHFFVKEQR